MSLLAAPEYIKNVECHIFEACGWQDCGEPTVIVSVASYFVDNRSYMFWVTQNVKPQSINFVPRCLSFEILEEDIKCNQYLREWGKMIKKQVFE